MAHDFQFWNPATWRKGDRLGIALSLAGLIALCMTASYVAGG